MAKQRPTQVQISNPYCFRAYATGQTTLTDSTHVKVLLASETYDYNNNFAGSTYTVPVAGVYHFDGKVRHASASGTPVQAVAELYVNGQVVVKGPNYDANAGIHFSWGISADILVAAGDTVELYHYQDSAGDELTSAVDADTWFSGHLVHAI